MAACARVHRLCECVFVCAFVCVCMCVLVCVCVLVNCVFATLFLRVVDFFV